MEYSIKPKILGERRIIHYPQKRIIGLYVDIIEKKRLLRYSMQLSMLRQLLNKKLINEFEYEKIKKRLMKDYNIISDITA